LKSNGLVDQLVDRLLCKQEATGSKELLCLKPAKRPGHPVQSIFKFRISIIPNQVKVSCTEEPEATASVWFAAESDGEIRRQLVLCVEYIEESRFLINRHIHRIIVTGNGGICRRRISAGQRPASVSRHAAGFRPLTLNDARNWNTLRADSKKAGNERSLPFQSEAAQAVREDVNTK